MWPGFGENTRVLKWVLERIDGGGDSVETAIGKVPTVDSLDVDGTGLTAEDLKKILAVDNQEWRQEIPLIEAHYESIGERLPQALADQLRSLEKRLAD
jgi:phosphoenolpyruvate carboxykinase (GTP)